MKLPLFLLGDKKIVKKQVMGRVLNKVKKYNSLIKAFEDEQLIDSLELDIPIGVEDSLLMYEKKNILHLYLLWDLLIKYFSFMKEKNKLTSWNEMIYIYEEIRKLDWGCLLLLNEHCSNFTLKFNINGKVKYLEYINSSWNLIKAEKLIFKIDEVKNIINESTQLKRELLLVGIPLEVLKNNDNLASILLIGRNS